MTLLVLLALFALAAFLAYVGRAFLAFALPIALGLFVWRVRLEPGSGSAVGWWFVLVLFAAALVAFGIPALRQRLVTRHAMRALAPIFPAMSDTERVALEAGTVWWDGELFSGRPRWKELLEFRGPELSERERSFLENEVEEVCRMVDNEEVDRRGDLSDEVWDYLKRKGFMGMIIPRAYGGLEFSALANSAVVTKVSSKSITLAVSVMVPNSLGPAELLLHYGTDEQRRHYLPRLADGREVPAFALTEPGAGSDASAMTSRGVVCRGTWQGEEVLGIRLNWNKRYITLAPVCTLLGLAFKLEDPDHLIGDREHLGITCALVPHDLPGVELGRRHDPLGIKFLNGPTTGHDVFVPIDSIIGGVAMAGQGWRMLMDCLSAGRSISLPGLACGACEVTARGVSAYALVREQFGLPLARFVGIEEPLARIAGRTWLMNAARKVTAQAVSSGQKPSVISAIVKAYLTESMRVVVNDGMDIQGGAGIVRGPRNLLARMYQAIPIGITVEGANILTRTLIIYGQGAIRCHPFAFAEIEAARRGDLAAFDRGLFGHLGFVVTNTARAGLLGWSGARLAVPPLGGPAGRGLQHLTRLSAAFALFSDAAMASLGGTLKRKERLTGRLADALAWLYIGSTCVKRWVDEGRRDSDLDFLRWSLEHACHEIEAALLGFLENLPNRPLAFALRVLAFPFGRIHAGPSDRLANRVARAVVENDELRERLTSDIHLSEDEQFGLGALDRGRRLALQAEAPRKKLKEAAKRKELARADECQLVAEALEKGLFEAAEAELVRAAHQARSELIEVDAFDPDEYLARCGA